MKNTESRKAKEIREMSQEQRDALLKETADKLFKLRVQARMERLDSPSEVVKAKRLIARIKTIQTEIAKKDS
ncbi:MAG: 50S ribosomal protein L29 [Thermoguttaceae bacterium]|nr:50S ribosomal protein L29 [Thermoguttaceae bacterium]MBR6481313.1 50S ribosomal protein L29 [Thermoguttaceae bacterium]MCR5359594.1 50S ribosomal protein L29 [Thermoguttaceae bacterium]